jgi:hypothetical protein
VSQRRRVGIDDETVHAVRHQVGEVAPSEQTMTGFRTPLLRARSAVVLEIRRATTHELSRYRTTRSSWTLDRRTRRCSPGVDGEEVA